MTDRELFPASSVTRWQTLTRQVFECTVALTDEEVTYHLEIEHELQTGRARVFVERLKGDHGLLFECVGGDVTLFRDNGSKGPSYSADWSESALARVAPRHDNKRLTRFLDFMRRPLVCGLYPRSVAAETTSEEPLLSRDGSNFASWYRHIFQERQDLIPAYLEDVKSVIEGFRGIRLERVGQDTRTFLVRLATGQSSYEVRLDELSDGQRALLALYALIRITQGHGYTLFLDEPDNYVALAEIQPWLMALKDACGSGVTQAVISSHHPELIDYLGAEAGTWIDRLDGGPSRAKALEISTNGPLKLSELVARGWRT